MDIYKTLVIIVTYNGKQWINRCLDSVVRNELSPATVFVVDNNSTDDTVEIIKSQYPEVILVQSEKNLGFGGANNIALDYAIEHSYDYVYLLNQDAWVMHDTFTKLITVHQNDHSIGVLSPLQTNAEKTKLDKNFATSLAKNTDALSDYVFGNGNEVYFVDFEMAAHWLISRECLLKVGKFSPVFFHYGEDDNYLHRTKFHGYKVAVVTSTMGVHDREYRKTSRKKDVYFLSVAFKITASNINNSFIFSVIKAYLYLLGSALLKAKKYKNIGIFFCAIPKVFGIGRIYKDRRRNKNINIKIR